MFTNQEKIKLSDHFYRHELECHGWNCCDNTYPDMRLVLSPLEIFRSICKDMVEAKQLLFKGVSVSSGFRCIAYNKQLYKKLGLPFNKKSKHPLALAVDISVSGLNIDEVFVAAVQVEDFLQGGIGLYPDFVHLDIYKEQHPRRWDNR